MIFLAFTWLGLIALWGTSERWHLATAARRRVTRALRALHHDSGAQPFDWARRW